MSEPSPQLALQAVRVAREAGDLSVAMRALDHVFAHLHEDPDLVDDAASEGELLGRELAVRGASLAALGEWLRAQEGGLGQRENIRRLLRTYAAWRPQVETCGAPRDGLKAGASGAFWVGRGTRGRFMCLEGGITGEGTEAFSRVLELSSGSVSWLFVDMEKLSYVGSTGLAVIVKVAERLKDRGGGVALFGLSSNLKLLVETLGLGMILNPSDDLEDALGQVGGRH